MFGKWQVDCESTARDGLTLLIPGEPIRRNCKHFPVALIHAVRDARRTPVTNR
jgi:hypothetical protein